MADFNSPAEQNARMQARAGYFRWLNKHYGSAELAEITDEPEPISLRQIFVPMRVSRKNRSETNMAPPEKVVELETPDRLRGEDAFDLVAESSFVCLSGLPGSGKTTLTKALVGELCGSHPSRLRTTLQGQRGIAPIPIVLRDIAGIDTIHSLEELMEAWWCNLQRQAAQSDSLDIARLRASFSTEGDAFPLLLLLDGLDETGGPDLRQALLDMAIAAHNHGGHRVVVTGRPSGFDGLDIPYLVSKEADNIGKIRWAKTRRETVGINLTKDCLYHLLPLAWPQIENFIDSWYRLRPEWEIKRGEGSAHFLEALKDPQRDYLLTLARRPIFLTLMALVHCTRNEMPHGRADLYEAIVDLYLNRQDRHRQRKNRLNTQGHQLKDWPVQEKRRVLARIAYQSQVMGSENAEAGTHPDRRRIVWQRADLESFIADYLLGRASLGGIPAEDAGQLLDYYLHPAGLLISPRKGEICFAHLSFQEYLCAEDIQRRLAGTRFADVFREDLVQRLGQPGWDEVGMLLLTMQKNRTDQGHLELLGLLPPDQAIAAGLLVRAVCSKELGLTPEQQRAWLPALLMSSLRHPYLGLGQLMGQCDSLASPGLEQLIQLFFLAATPEEQWQVLESKLKENIFLNWADESKSEIRQIWLTQAWNPDEPAPALRLYSLLNLISDTNWGLCENEDHSNSQPTIEPQTVLENAVVSATSDDFLLWQRIKWGTSDMLPCPTDANLVIDAILPISGNLWRRILEAIPPDFWLLEVEVLFGSMTSIQFTQYPCEELPARNRMSLGVFPVLLLSECFTLADIKSKRSSYRLRFLDPSFQNIGLRMKSLSRWIGNSRSGYRSRLRSILPTVSFPNSNSLRNLMTLSPIAENPAILSRLKDCQEKLEGSTYYPNDSKEELDYALDLFGHRYATHDWFTEQAENPDLVRRRGLIPGEPLPRSLGLFDQRGIPLVRQDRQSWLALQAWLNDDDAVLAFFFPEGLTAGDDRLLRSDLAILKQQPWSPHAFLSAALAEWPEQQRYRDFGLETAQQEMLMACEQFLAQTESGPDQDET
ncbi:hypothetical protein A1507_09080 [Methylomonas koyamae]|uniref:NACHT domain-containing protein n=1 Tax=Methylomonas koyamae TaxID=702114 RepID=A0A177NKW6_9GAMM|nr:hypothetical protein [Methylomonas koyamae]OAI18502.1 hypothetical protein A1507_09080 [Methylomonas koyamae]